MLPPAAATPAAWLLFLAFVVLLAVVAVSLARQSARLVRAGQVPPPPVLYANVVGTQTLVVVLIAIAAWLASVPVGAFGMGSPAAVIDVVFAGAVVGLALFVASVVATRVLSRAGVTYSEALRDALEPRTTNEAIALYGVALPAVSVGEELLFRGALVGASTAGFDVSPWLPAVGSSALFGYAHSAQGTAGVVATGVLGLVLAGLFIVTDSLLAVVVAHYVVNALEFAIGQRLTEY